MVAAMVVESDPTSSKQADGFYSRLTEDSVDDDDEEGIQELS